MSDNSKWKGLHGFWSSFGIPAYDASAVPDDAQMPYITYTGIVAGFEDVIPIEGHIWYHSTSWAEASEKADEIAAAVSPHRLVQLGDREYLFLAKGSPFAQRMADTDDTVKRVYINIMAEYFTAK